VIFGSSTVLADCKDGWICVDAISQGSNIELRAKNLREYPITYTLRVRTRDLTVDGPHIVTRTLAPNQTEQVMVLSGGTPQREGNYRYSFDWTVGNKDAVHDDDHLYALPYSSGKLYRVLRQYRSYDNAASAFCRLPCDRMGQYSVDPGALSKRGRYH